MFITSKKVFFLFFLTISFSINFNNAIAQKQLGGGVAYSSGDGVSNMGLNFRGQFNLTEVIPTTNKFMRIETGVYYFAKNNSTSIVELNANFNYLFGNMDALSYYPLAGLNFSNANISSFGFNTSKSELSINLGGGLNYNYENKLLFGEVKYKFGDFDRLVFTAGIMFPLNF